MLAGAFGVRVLVVSSQECLEPSTKSYKQGKSGPKSTINNQRGGNKEGVTGIKDRAGEGVISECLEPSTATACTKPGCLDLEAYPRSGIKEGVTGIKDRLSCTRTSRLAGVVDSA